MAASDWDEERSAGDPGGDGDALPDAGSLDEPGIGESVIERTPDAPEEEESEDGA